MMEEISTWNEHKDIREKINEIVRRINSNEGRVDRIRIRLRDIKQWIKSMEALDNLTPVKEPAEDGMREKILREVGKCLDSHLKGAERSEPLKHRFFHEDKEVYKDGDLERDLNEALREFNETFDRHIKRFESLREPIAFKIL